MRTTKFIKILLLAVFVSACAPSKVVQTLCEKEIAQGVSNLPYFVPWMNRSSGEIVLYERQSNALIPAETDLNILYDNKGNQLLVIPSLTEGLLDNSGAFEQAEALKEGSFDFGAIYCQAYTVPSTQQATSVQYGVDVSYSDTPYVQLPDFGLRYTGFQYAPDLVGIINNFQIIINDQDIRDITLSDTEPTVVEINGKSFSVEAVPEYMGVLRVTTE